MRQLPQDSLFGDFTSDIVNQFVRFFVAGLN